MESAKLTLSKKELRLVSNGDWILTKNEIMRKTRDMMGRVHRSQQASFQHKFIDFPEELLQIHGKISRGENCRGLPYLMLDYPRHFERENIFAIRHFFWWGRIISTTLHLSGAWQDYFSDDLKASANFLGSKGYLIYLGDDEWDHDMTGTPYKFINEGLPAEYQDRIDRGKFVKIGKWQSVDQLNGATAFWEEQFADILTALTQFPSR